VLVLAVASGACSSGSTNPLFVPLSGPLPTITARTLDGRSFDPADYRGRIVVVNFWNQDCPPCRTEQPVLQSASRALSARGVVVIGVLYVGGNWPNDATAARAFLQENGVTYPNLQDPSSKLARAFDIVGIPSTVVADGEGQLRFRILGRVRPGQLEELVDRVDQT
jgi:peroxiredoxin